jgi:thiol:disulfide interchange protein DsbA
MTARGSTNKVALTIAAFVVAFGGIAAQAADGLAKWRVGQHYQLLPEPLAPAVTSGKVEVAEVFWYGCAHCAALDPVLEGWNSSKPAFIEFVRVPVIWGPPHRQHAKLYYTLQALRRPELHAKVFEVIHKDGAPLSDRDEVVAREMHFAFVSRYGITQQQFDAAYDSMTVAMNMQRAETFTRKAGVDNVPLMFVNGKYAASVGSAGGDPQLLALINDLAESEKR